MTSRRIELCQNRPWKVMPILAFRSMTSRRLGARIGDDLWRRRFWHSSIFRIGFSFDDVTSNRTPESALESDADSGISFDDVTSTQSRRPMASPILAVLFWATFWCVSDSGGRPCAAVFHCDILNPAQGLNIYIW